MNVRLRNSFKRVIGVVLLGSIKGKGKLETSSGSPKGASSHAENRHSPVEMNNNKKEKGNLNY